MNDLSQIHAVRTFHHHWLAFWKLVAITALLVVLGSLSMLAWPPLGFGLLLLGAVGAVSVYLFWAWHTFTFINGNRLIRRRGFLGCAEDVITLFGVISPYQIPLFGRLLDVGSVHLGIPGPNVHIHHIANFGDFHRLLVYGAEQQQRQVAQPPFQVFIQMPPQPYYWPDHARELRAQQPQPVHFYAEEVRD